MSLFYFPVLKKFRSLGLGQVRPTLTEENGIFTLEAFPQNFSSDEEFSPYQRRKPRKTQKVAESDIKSQSNFDQLFDSGTIQGKVNLLKLYLLQIITSSVFRQWNINFSTSKDSVELHELSQQQLLVDRLTPESKKLYFKAYFPSGEKLPKSYLPEEHPDASSFSSPEYCPKRASSRAAKRKDRPPSPKPLRKTASSARRPQRFWNSWD